MVTHDIKWDSIAKVGIDGTLYSRILDTEKYNIINKFYLIELIRKKDGRKEHIFLRVASKNLSCGECSEPILRGERYIRDAFSNYDDYTGNFWRKVNFVCLKCWKNIIPLKIKRNWIK